MKIIIAILSIVILMGWMIPVMAADSMSSHDHGSMAGMAHDQKDMDAMSDMKQVGEMNHEGAFKRKEVADGIRAEFQIMSLASMNMKDTNGASHHIMVTFFKDAMNQQIKNAIGKIKVINPEKKEQIGELKDYNGIYAANFTFDALGEYGVICLARIEGKEHIYKFWYPHH